MFNFLRQLLREPLVHFMALALLIFAAYRILNPALDAPLDRIDVSQARIEQLMSLFAKTWQRPPTPEELKGLIDDFVKEEISYREALALGLDQDDTVIRRRMRQKLEFLASIETEPPPSESELQAYLDQHREKYAPETVTTFSHVYFDPARRGASLEADIASALEILNSSTPQDQSVSGDANMLPQAVDLAPTSMVAREFGSDFAAVISKTEIGEWTGPIRSSLGMHLVRVRERKTGGPPTLDAARASVTRDFLDQRRKAREASRYAELLKKYTVDIQMPALDLQDRNNGR